jgi:hypothetical protein
MQQVILEIKADEVQETTGRKNRFDIVDLYEEMLSRRADMGFRPVLYVASEVDLECNLIGLYEGEISEEASGEAIPVPESMTELRRRLR